MSMHRDLLETHGFIGSMSRRGNPYDNPQAESFMKTLKVEGAYLTEYETFEEVAAGVPRFIEAYSERRLHSALGYLSPISGAESLAMRLLQRRVRSFRRRLRCRHCVPLCAPSAGRPG